jgi:sporulation protein YqfC
MRSAVNQTLRKKLAHALDLPAFVLLDQATVHILGDSDVKIVNHKGLVQYTTDCIKARSTQGLIEVVGENMEIVSFSSGEIKIAGKILQVMLK